MKKIIYGVSLLNVIFFSSLSSKSQTFIPVIEKNSKYISSVFKYNFSEGANRPSAHIIFQDGYSFILNSVCSQTDSDGISYDWCIRNAEFEDVAYMTIIWGKKGIIEIKILHNNLSKKYIKYLNLFKGFYVETDRLLPKIPHKGSIK